MKLLVLEVRQPTELGAALETMRRERTDALVLVADPLLFSETRSIVELAARDACRPYTRHGSSPRPAACSPTVRCRRNASSAWLSTWTVSCVAPAPESCPSSSRRNSELVINMKTAKALGLTIPPSLLLRADQIIE